jgi:hypothetical protein
MPSRAAGGVCSGVQASGNVVFEEPTAEERELAMGVPRGFTAAPGVSDHTQRELLGQAMDLNSVLWILAAARAAGERRSPLGGDAVRLGSEVAARVQPRAEGAGPKAAGTGRQTGATRVQPRAEGAGPRAAGTGRQTGAAGVQPRAEGAGPRAAETGRQTGAVVGPRVEGLQGQVQVAGACLGEQTKGAGNGSEAKPQPQEAVKVGGGPSGEGWKVGAQLTKEEGSSVAAVVERNRDVFAFSLEEIGEFKLLEVELKLKSEQPIFERRRRHSIREWELVDERCRELEAAGIIEECDSDFAANSVMAAKKDPEGSWKLARFCTDLRRINEQTAQDRYPMPLPEEVLEGLGHAKFYSTIDIRGAFHQLVVKQSDRRKLAFWSSSKLYCWKRCPFGARNASAWFQRAIDRTLRGLEGFARSFMDDLLVAGGETVEEHMELVQRVFERLREVGPRCHPEKCCFAATEVEYLGMWRRPGVVSPQVAKVAAIAALPRPTDVTLVRAFSGVVNYYRQFIPNCSRIQAPLNALTKKGAPWEWGLAQEGTFQALKEALQGEPVLMLPRRGRPFRVRCDWSRKGVGGVLLQEDESGVERVVAYGSRSCNGAVSRYSSFEGELLAAVYFVRL